MGFREEVGKGLVGLSIFLGAGCGEVVAPSSQVSFCAPSELSVVASSTGKAQVFLLDPIVSSGNLNLSPTSGLDAFRMPVELSRLDGTGVLRGKYIEAVNGLNCDFDFGAYSLVNDFSYPHRDPRFQEAMAYYFGDLYRSSVDQTGYLQSRGPVTIIAHCEDGDNSSFMRQVTSDGVIEIVCLYNSETTPGAFYGDDVEVTIHELQHATTLDNYSLTEDMSHLLYDEAGALNEAISDFMSLMFADEYLPENSSLDPRVFSRWALGTFDPERSHVRGAHRCPIYDSHYPECERFPAFEIPNESNSESTTVSYIYPDGLGWPFPHNYKGTPTLLKTFQSYPGQEEIHSAGMIPLGTLWEIYTGLLSNHPGNQAWVRKVTTQLVMETVRQLPAANSSTNISPITFVGFASLLKTVAEEMSEMTLEDRAQIEKVLNLRGLSNFTSIESTNWLEVGTGTNDQIPSTPTPGVYIADDPQLLKRWLRSMWISPSIVTQDLSTGLNSRLDPGEAAAIWFDLQNTSNITAGGVLLSVTSSDPDILILRRPYNEGYMDSSGENQAQVMYAKVNGTDIVSALNPVGNSSSIPIGNSYFKTNPTFYKFPMTAVWIKVNPQASHGKVVQLEVRALPSNGVASTQIFPVVIH